jgi:hypothetical protein
MLRRRLIGWTFWCFCVLEKWRVDCLEIMQCGGDRE